MICHPAWDRPGAGLAGAKSFPRRKYQHGRAMAVVMMKKEENSWHVYIVCCRDGTYYTGIARNLARRIREHNSLKSGARYTRSRRPVQLVYAEPAPSRSAAAKREYQLKRMPLARKKELIDAAQLLLI